MGYETNSEKIVQRKKPPREEEAQKGILVDDRCFPLDLLHFAFLRLSMKLSGYMTIQAISRNTIPTRTSNRGQDDEDIGFDRPV